MVFDLSNIHVVHVLAAYGAAAVLMGGLILATLCDYLKARRK